MKKEDYFTTVGKSFVDNLSNKSPDQISAEVSYMTLTEHLEFISEVLNTLEIELGNDGLEIGAGAAVFATTLTRLYPNISKIHALEIVPGMVTKLQPKIIEHTNMQNRVIPLIGDFDYIKFPDSSLDFVVEFDALHHSNDLKKTLKEIGRVLKPGGKLICFDRAHPNHLTKAQENFLLNIEYNTDYKIQHGLDSIQPYCRSDNGEHEPRIRDWNNAILNTGLEIDKISVFTKRSFRDFLKLLASHIPYFLRNYFGKAKNLTAHSKLLLYYILPFFARYGKLKIFPLHTEFKTITAPFRKMVIVISKQSS